ncbi:MAG: TRAP transporter small permease [Alphaproteobacteria bacterium]|nr:MAG: TRAP transporter small permease [Alphaproteobacteria bacterium]
MRNAMSTEPVSRTGPDGAGADVISEQIAEATRQQELADPDRGLPFLDRAVNKVVEIIGVGVLCTIVGTIFVNAVSRYAFNYSFNWVEELVIYLTPWLAMTGLFLAIRRGTMIRIEYFYENFTPAIRRPIALLGNIVSVGVLLFLGGISFHYVTLFGGDLTVHMRFFKGFSTGALMVGGFGAALAFLVILVREARRENP